MASTLPYLLSPAAAQFLNYIQAWGGIPLREVDTDPIHPDLGLIDIPSLANENHVRFRLANDCLHRGYGHYRDLLTTLSVDSHALKAAIAGNVPFRKWFWRERERFAWYQEDRMRANAVIDDLFQLNRCLDQAADRIDQWQAGGFRLSPPGMEQHFHWLRRLFVSRVRLAEEALHAGGSGAPETQAHALSLSTFFDDEKRRVFGVIGMNASLAEFFNLRRPPPPAQSA